MGKKKTWGYSRGKLNPNAKMTERVRAKALYLESLGKLPQRQIAKELKVNTTTITEWKRADHWDEDLQKIKLDSQHALNTKMLKATETQSLLSGIPTEQLEKAVRELMGKNISEAISNILFLIHKRDIEDLSELNKAIRLQLTPDSITDLKSQDIVNLTNAKATIIKTIRNIFGQTTADQPLLTHNSLIQLNLNSQQYESLKTLGMLQQTAKVTIEQKESPIL